MRAIFRRAIISMASTPNRRPNPTRPGLRLRDVAAQLRLCKPKSTTAGDDSGDDVDDRGKVFSQLALPESSAAAAAPSIQPKFRPQRAAVLVCLFEGESGDLRVILTKRSSNLSTHSGLCDQNLLLFGKKFGSLRERSDFFFLLLGSVCL